MKTLISAEIDRSGFPEHTSEQFMEWLEFVLGARADLNMENPLFEVELECSRVSAREIP